MHFSFENPLQFLQLRLSYILNQHYKNYNLLLVMLSNTKKSTILDSRKSSKLPKLTIQQQIDNEQVIQRMNRKITFTKNQRHLVKTFQSSSNGSVFRIEPEQLYFTNFEINKIYESQVKLVNRSKVIQRIKITPLQKKEFVVSNVKYPTEQSGDIAPGMQVSIFVRFKPTNLHDNEDQLLVIVGDGVIRIPIKAQRQKCRGQWPAQINCGHCWVGDQVSRQIIIPNNGGQAIYKLRDAQQNEKVVGFFKIWPTQIKLQKNKKNVLNISFCPQNQGLFEQSVTYVSNQGNEQQIKIKLKGGAYSAEITLDQINNQKVAVKRFHNCLYLSKCQPGKESSSSFKIHNHAVVPVDYLWHYSSQTNLKITPQRGKIPPAEMFTFTASYLPTDRNPQSIVAYLYLYNLPKQSLLNNPTTKIINGQQMIQCLKLQVKATSQNSNIEVTPLHKAISEKLYIGKQKRTNFTISNNSPADRKYWIEKIKDDNSCSSSCQLQGQKLIKTGESQQIWFNFSFKQLTKQNQKSYYLVHFDNLPSKMISIQGHVQYPDLQFYSTNVEYQLLRTFSTYKKILKIANTGENQVQFIFNNLHRFYQLEFYDLYEFENENFYYRKLNILCDGTDCQGQITIQAGSEKVLEFELQTRGPEIIDLQVQLLIKNGNKYKIKVLGQVQQASARISQNYIPMKQIFQGNVYNSNKFLPKQLSIENPGNLPIRYEILPSQIEECLITISKMTGIVAPRTKRRIDLVIEPLKTGIFKSAFKINFYDDIPLYPEVYSQNNEIMQILPEQRKKIIGEDLLRIQGKIRGVETAYYLKDQSKAKRVSQKMSDDAHMSVKMSTYSHKSGSRSHYLQNYKLVYPVLEELNFFNCQINKVQQLEIIIENNSQLTTEFEVYAQNYRSTEKSMNETKSQSKGMMQGQELAFTSDMGKTYIQNRALNQAQKVYLSNNKGISIMCQPSSGVLNKRQLQKIVIRMFNDASGRFKDNLVISIKDHQVKKFPINIQIKGTPVSLSRNQLGINFNREIPLLNAGTFLRKNGKSTRNIKILNNGPREVQLKWLIYPYGAFNADQDIFNINFNGAQSGSNNLVQLNWQAIKPLPLINSPFSITPEHKVLKGREETSFLLTIQERSQCESLQVLVIGVPTMLQQAGKVPMEDLAIVVQADFVSPSLKVDQNHPNEINKLQKFAIIGNEERTQANNHILKIKLKNHHKCNIGFDVAVETDRSKTQHFEIISTSTNSPLNKLKPKTLTSATNKIKTIAAIDIEKQFTLPYESYVEVGIELKADSKNASQWPMEPKVRKDGNLIINFSNGQKQTIPLVGWLYRPYIQIQMPNQQLYSIENMFIDFGVVHVNNYKKKSIYLANPTKSAIDWTITYTKYQQTKKIIFQKELWTDLDYEDENIVDEKKCFRLNQDSGHLLAETIPIHYIPGTLALNSVDDKYAETHKPFKLDFVFKPETKALYKSKFIIKAQYGPSYQIILCGRGVFEEQAQIK